MPSITKQAQILTAMLREEPTQFRHSVSSFFERRRLYRFSSLSPADWRQSADEVRQKLTVNLRKPGPLLGNAAWIDEVIDVLVERSQDSISHSDATERVASVAQRLSARTAHAEAFFAVARACGSVGLFEGSYPFTKLAHARLELNTERTTNLRESLSAVLVALHQQDLDLAVTRWNSSRSARVPSGVTREIFDMLDRYMAILTRSSPVGLPNSPLIADASNWKNDLRGKNVLVLGPGPREFDLAGVERFDFVTQIFRNRELHRFSTPSQNKDILYVGGDLYRMLEKLDRDEIAERFSDFKYFAIKSLEPRLGLSNTRQTERLCSRLFLNGHPNMVPLMCVDLLVPDDVSLYVVGVNFYASKEPYTAGEIDAYSRFHMCHSITSHNPLENRALVGNLVKAGLVDGEKAFHDVLELSDVEYLRVLDEHFGSPQR